MRSKFMRPGKIHNINLLTPDGRKNVNIYIVQKTFLCIHCLNALKLHNAGVRCEANSFHYGYIHRDEANQLTEEERFMKLSDMFPSEYLRGIDVGKPFTVTIRAIEAEQVRNQYASGKVETEWVMRFNEIPKKLRLNLTMVKACALFLENDNNPDEIDPAKWVGKKVTIYRTKTKARGEEHLVPRIRQPERGDVDLTQAVKAAQKSNGNGQEEKPAFATIKALLAQLYKDFSLSEEDAKARLKELGFTGFTTLASGKMYQAIKESLAKPMVDPETGEVDELGFGEDDDFDPTTPMFADMEEATQNSGAGYSN